ncbi:hypothetical protein SAMN04489806_2087 [Paramicrobacterium humi]|uniref:Uncharacterized protein n=1 Tax=Paramicrobacterium humi TaxID=640635 RepID=A0A1H4N5Y2_9MICO|nr:hypothetical protein [Microbacterium humi]SEB90414.1 hypothetical protein SAMN04489806_2087 [Microbacterium humi]
MPDAIADWQELLDRFEDDLASQTADERTWMPPGAPLPASLADRARLIVARQREAIARIEQEMSQVQLHLHALKRVPPVRTDAAIYLDVDG